MFPRLSHQICIFLWNSKLKLKYNPHVWSLLDTDPIKVLPSQSVSQSVTRCIFQSFNIYLRILLYVFVNDVCICQEKRAYTTPSCWSSWEQAASTSTLASANSVKNFGIPKIGKGITPLCVATLRLWLYSFFPPSHKTTVGICHSERLWRPGSGGNVWCGEAIPARVLRAR